MASSGHQVTLTVAKQGAVFHGLAMLICQEPTHSLPSMAECYLIVFCNIYFLLSLPYKSG